MREWFPELFEVTPRPRARALTLVGRVLAVLWRILRKAR